MTREESPDYTLPKTLEDQFLADYEKYSDAIFRHCFFRVRDREIARDIAQDTFSKAWVYLSQGNSVEYMRAFLYRIANNLIVDWSRKKKSSSLDAMMDDDGFEIADDSIRDFADVPAAREAVKMLEELEDTYRVPITMRYLDEMPISEIARALSVSENVVSVRIHRGIEKLGKIVRPPKPSM